VTLVTLNRPKMNALSRELLSRLDDLVDDLQADLPGAVVVWGGGRVFSAGAEVSELARPGAAAEVTRAFHALTARIAALPRVTVAAINGYALGGGLELALACDFRVVAADARLGQPEILLGIIPGGGATQRLPRLVGAARAKDLIFTGRQVQADEALGMGLADRVAPRAEVLEAALALAAQMAAGPHLARAAAKRIIDEGAGLPMSRALELEAAAFVSVFGTEDARLGIESFLRHGPGRALFVGR
jgi:enoyl-CoA hydratase